jgi:hypothetical protein
VDTFVIISGDSDFSPLVSKLRENNKEVIGVGVKSSTSDLLINNCDEFIFYDDLVRDQQKRRPRARKQPARTAPRGAPKSDRAGDKGTDRQDALRLDERYDPRGEDRAEGRAAEEPTTEARVLDDRVADERSADKLQEAFDLVVETLEALIGERGADERVWGSMVKQALKRVRPGFNESYYGFRSFNALLEEAQARGLVRLERDEKSGGYAVRMGAE